MSYNPQEIVKTVYESPEKFLEQLKIFFKERIEFNKNNLNLKEREIRSFEEILLILNDISDLSKVDWDYHMPFEGFKKYLQEKNIHDYILIIEKEGKESNTLKSAYEIGLDNVKEDDSMKCSGLRIADMMVGIISKLMKALCDALRYESIDKSIDKKILDNRWFNLNDTQLQLYKKFYKIICEWQPAYYKSYTGIYSDDLILFSSLLNYMNYFESVEQIKLN